MPIRLTVRATLAAVPIHLLQLHGDEDEAYCRQFDRPYIKAARVRPGMDLLQYAAAFPSAQAILLDAFVDGYGGGGRVFDWSLVPPALGKPLILSGGLDADNVGEAVRRLRPRRWMSRRGSRRARESRMRTRCVPLWPQCGRLNR
jgi:phosphoribosylanthranilate isomerase